MIQPRILLILVLVSSWPLVGCQTANNIAPHYKGSSYKRLAAANSVELRKLPDVDFDTHLKSMNKQGYLMIGGAMFRGAQQTIPQIKSFAASIGADLVEGAANQVGTAQRTYMGVSSYTPGSTITTFGTAAGYASGTSTGRVTTPFGPMSYNSQSSGTAFGTSASSTYVPGQVTYAPRTYNVPISDQTYIFWVSPSAYLRNWMDNAKMAFGDLPPAQQPSMEDIKLRAALFAQAWNVPLPAGLRPAQPIPQLSPELLAQTRAGTAEAQKASLQAGN
jgi:hypothetical protein